MKRYFVEKVAVASADNRGFAGEVQSYIISKTGRVTRTPGIVWEYNGWAKKRYAEKYIEKDVEWHKQFRENWVYAYRVVAADFEKNGLMSTNDLD